MPKLLLFCTGTLIKLAIGFCAAFRSTSAFVDAAGVSSVANCVPDAPIGESCAVDIAASKRNIHSMMYRIEPTILTPVTP
jgi:hypothetical protein